MAFLARSVAALTCTLADGISQVQPAHAETAETHRLNKVPSVPDGEQRPFVPDSSRR